MPACRKKKKCVDQGGQCVPLTPPNNSDHRAAIRRQPLSWSDIPATALCKIFQSLSDVDRVSLAQVNKSYNEVFRTPSLWRSRFIEFDRPRCTEQTEMETLFKSETGLLLSSGKSGIIFAQKFRHCLKDLDICVKLISPVSREILSDFTTLSENLDDAKLTNLKITYPGLLSLDSTRRKGFIKPLIRLLRHQHNLKSFAINLSYLDIGIGLNFLSCLAQSSGDTLEKISMNNLFFDIDVYQDGRLVIEMQKFKNIRSVAMDYAILSEELLEIWAQGYPTLSYLKLRAVHTGHEISSQAWKNLRETHPSLLVEFLVQKIESTARMLPALSPAIPVYKLLWESEGEKTSEFELTNLLNRVASYETTMKYLFVKILGKDVTLDTLSVQILLSNCRKLLPFTCTNFGHSLGIRTTWILSQDNRSLQQDDT